MRFFSGSSRRWLEGRCFVIEFCRMQHRDLAPTAEEPQWQLRATESKNGRCDLVPILSDLLPALAPLWSSLPSATSRLIRDGLGFAVPRCETLHADLAHAGITPRGRRRAARGLPQLPLHFLPLGEVLPIQKVKVLMRHATISLTADLYGRLGIDDLGEEVWNLPTLGIDDLDRPTLGVA